MPVSFKQPISIKAFKKTPQEDLVLCDECGGFNALGRVAVKIECATCGGTGYDNYYTEMVIPGYYRPGAVKRWDQQSGGVVFLGECSVKVDAKYGAAIASAQFLEVNGQRWNFARIADPGTTLGQPRLLLALNRK